MQIVTSFFSSLTSVMGAAWGARLMGVWLMSVGLGAAAEVWQAEAFQLAPEVDQRWQEWMEAARPLRVKKETERMAGVIAELQKNHELDEAKAKVLQGVVPGLVKETVRDWEQFLRQIHRPAFQGTGKEGLEAMGVFNQDPVTMMAGHEIAFYLLPQERAAFVNAVSQVLPAEAFVRWEEGRVKRGEDRKKQGRSWVEAGIKERQPAKIYAGELAQALESGLAILGKDSAEGKALTKQVETWAAAYEQVCREVSILRVDSFLYPTGPGWGESMKRGWFLFLPRRTGVINAHREALKKMTMEGGGTALLAELAKRWEPEDFKLDPEVELAWEARMVEGRDEHRRQKQGKLEREVEKLQKSGGLTSAGAAAIKREIPQLIERGRLNWEQSMRTVFRGNLRGEPKAALAQLEQRITAKWLGEIPGDYREDTINGKEWSMLLQRHLSRTDFEVWETQRKTQLEARGKETEVMLAEGVKKLEAERRLHNALQVWAGNVGVSLVKKTDGDSSKEEQGWVGEVQKQFRELVVEFEKASLKESRLWLDVCSIDGPTWTSVRKKGFYYSILPMSKWRQRAEVDLMKLLPEEVRVAHAKGMQEREKRLKLAVVKARVMALELMTPLDEAQRKAVEALAAALTIEKEEPILTPQVEPYPWRVWKTVEGAKRVYEILDDRQERLLAKGLARLEQGNSHSGASGETQPVALRHPALGPADMTGVEAAISEHLAATSREQSLRGLETVLREVELVGRVVGLDEAAVSALELAAKGTAQRAAEAHRVNQGRYMRSQVQGATPDTIRERLRTVGGYSFYMGREGPTLVEETLDSLITDEQRKQVWAYQDAVKKRQKEAILLVLLARVDQALGLSEEQSATLAAKLQEVMEKYGPDIEQNFRGWGERMPWFLQGYYLMLPGAGVSDADLKAVLNERQLTLWDAEVTQRGGSYWAQVLEYHEQRKNQGRGSAAKRRIFFEQ